MTALPLVTIGGSEAAAACGLDPYKSRVRLWAEKIGLFDPEEAGEPAEWGKRLQPLIAEAVEGRGYNIIPAPTDPFYSETRPWMRASLHRRADDLQEVHAPMTDARQALERVAAPRERKTIYDLIERQAPAIEKALPAAIGAERFTRIVLTEVRRNSALLECHPDSLLAAMMLTAQLGLEPGPLGLVYFVPFNKQVQWILGYKGMIELARRSDRMRDIVARTVHEGDDFEYEYGLRDKLRHRPSEPSERGKAVCWYGIARYAPSGATLAVLYPDDVEAHRKRSPAAQRGSGPWTTDYDAMARKTVIRTMAPYLPMAPMLARAVEADGGLARGLDDNAEPVVEGEAEEASGGCLIASM